MSDPDNTPTAETVVVVGPSASGVVAVVGTQPIPWFLDLNGDGIPDWQQRGVRDAVANIAFGLLGRLFPGSAQAMTLKQLQPAITTIIQAGSK